MNRFAVCIFLLFQLTLAAGCTTLSAENSTDRNQYHLIEGIPLETSRKKVESIMGIPSDVVEYNEGLILYYDEQIGHHERPLAKFSFNRSSVLVGKTWYCQKSCEKMNIDEFKKRYPASSFSVEVPQIARKTVHGPHERIHSNLAAGINIEMDGETVIAIHWDQSGSSYLNR